MLQNSRGDVTGGLYGLMDKIVNKIKEGYKLVACFDPPRADLDRTKMLDSYKASRVEKPAFITWQSDKSKEILPLIPLVDCYTSDSSESDDTMATLAIRYALAGHKVVIDSRDKDMFPCLEFEQIRIWRENNFRTRATFVDEYGFPPGRFNEYLAIAGDAADNFNLFQGLGDKAAKDLIGMTNHITEVWKKWNTVPKKYQKKLAHHDEKGTFISHRKEDLSLSLKLATLNYEANCIPMNKDGGKAYVKNALEHLEFNSILPLLDLLYGES
jgi:5'-3' exonuclease